VIVWAETACVFRLCYQASFSKRRVEMAVDALT
jgi:hypothetical protein